MSELPALSSVDLPFPGVEQLLGDSARRFFETEWQQTVRLFPKDHGRRRLDLVGFDFRAVVEAASKVGKVEALGGKGRPGPGPGEVGWPEVPNAASARVARSEDFSAPLADLTRRMTEEVSHRVQANLYVSPPESRGLDRHRDGHDVLVLQVEGRKRWRIWKTDELPPLDPFPALPFEGVRRFRKDYRGTPFGGRNISEQEVDAKAEWDFELEAGDLIHVPRGWPHEVWTEGSHSAHLTFGFHLVSWVDLLMAVVGQASRKHAPLRDALPVGFARVGPPADLVREAALPLQRLLATMDAAEAMEEVIGRWLHRDLDAPPAPEKLPETLPLDDDTRLRRRGPAAFVTRADSVGLFRSSAEASEIWMPAPFAKALQFVATVEPGDFRMGDLPGVSPSSRKRLCEMLVAKGFVEPVAKDVSTPQA